MDSAILYFRHSIGVVGLNLEKFRQPIAGELLCTLDFFIIVRDWLQSQSLCNDNCLREFKAYDGRKRL